MKIKTLLASLLLALLLITATAAPAQEIASGPMLFEISGTVSFNSVGQISVDGIPISAGTAFNPASLRAGEEVLVIVQALPNGDLQAVGLTRTEEAQTTQTTLTGPVTVNENGQIVVNNIVLIADSRFDLTALEPGDNVYVTGYLLPDGMSLQIVSLTVFGDNDDDDVDDNEDDVDDNDDSTDNDDVDEGEDDECFRPDHPVAQAIANEFEVSYDEVIGFHCDGNGFGEIARAYMLAELTEDDDDTAAYYLELHQSGIGWGQIWRDLDINPSDLAPGRIIGAGRGNGDDCPGNSCNAPGHNRDDCPGNSCNTPGHNRSNGNGNGNGNGNR